MTIDVLRFMEGNGAIYCGSKEERAQALAFLQEIGYSLGFRPEEYRDVDWKYVYLHGGYVHMGSSPGDKKEKLDFSELLALYEKGNELPEPEELPDVSDLFPELKVVEESYGSL